MTSKNNQQHLIRKDRTESFRSPVTIEMLHLSITTLIISFNSARYDGAKFVKEFVFDRTIIQLLSTKYLYELCLYTLTPVLQDLTGHLQNELLTER